MSRQRGGPGRGQGRKPLDASGEAMRSRPIRMTDAQWSDAKIVGMDEIRSFVTRRAKRKKLLAPR